MSLATKLAERRAEDLLVTDRWRCRCGAANVMTQCGACGRRAPSDVSLAEDPYPWAPFTVAETPAASRRMTKTALMAIGIGAATQGAVWLLLRTRAVEPTIAIRFSLLVTLGFYAVVALLLATRARSDGPRPVWTTGRPIVGALIGFFVGTGVAGGLLALLSVANQHASSDQFITMVVSEGTTGRVIVMAVIAVLCAPLVEEWLFRGMVAEGLRDHNRRKALLLSAALFSLWHLRLAAFRYYFLVGLLLGALYLKRGLVASMTAHAAFNGTILVVAIAVAHGSAHTHTGPGVSVTAPGAWHKSSSAHAGMLLSLRGPSGSEFAVASDEFPRVISADELATSIRNRGVPTPGITADIASAEVVTLPVGQAAKVEVELRGRRGTLLLMPKPGKVVLTIVAVTGGSPRAARDLEGMLKTLEVVG